MFKLAVVFGGATALLIMFSGGAHALAFAAVMFGAYLLAGWLASTRR